MMSMISRFFVFFHCQVEMCLNEFNHCVETTESLLKNADLDPSQRISYCPIWNLTVLSKTLEQLIARQLIDHLSEWKLLPEKRPTYCSHHFTETAVLHVLSNIYKIMAIRLLWRYLTCQPHSTPSITRHLFITWKSCMASTVLLWCGFHPTYNNDNKTFTVETLLPPPQYYCAGSHKDQSLDQFYFFSTIHCGSY